MFDYSDLKRLYPHLGWSQLQLITKKLPPDQREAACQSLSEGYPLEYILKEASWGSLTLKIQAPLLIPREDTWSWLIQFVKDYKELLQKEPLYIADLGCGPGTIGLGLSVLSHRDNLNILAIDYSDIALAIAAENAALLGLTHYRTCQSDWLSALSRPENSSSCSLFDLIISNPPYCDKSIPFWYEESIEDAQARFALKGGLEPYALILEQSLCHLKKHGLIVFEHGCDQLSAIAMMAQYYGYQYKRAYWDHCSLLRASVFQKII